ncbi:MAG: hypothetical protein ACKVP3_05685, partial [Hyphomicrobiaceae bacterium]
MTFSSPTASIVRATFTGSAGVDLSPAFRFHGSATYASGEDRRGECSGGLSGTGLGGLPVPGQQVGDL